MKNTLIIFCLLLSNSLFSQKQNIGAHIGAGFVVGTSVNFIPQFKVSKRPGKAIWIGGVTGVMAGLSKEFHDYALGSPMDKGDLINTIWGGFLGGITACELHKIINKRKQKRKKIVSL